MEGGPLLLLIAVHARRRGLRWRNNAITVHHHKCSWGIARIMRSVDLNAPVNKHALHQVVVVFNAAALAHTHRHLNMFVREFERFLCSKVVTISGSLIQVWFAEMKPEVGCHCSPCGGSLTVCSLHHLVVGWLEDDKTTRSHGLGVFCYFRTEWQLQIAYFSARRRGVTLVAIVTRTRHQSPLTSLQQVERSVLLVKVEDHWTKSVRP
jgi:hypothetical protein